MTERRYNEAEVAAIFERATEAAPSGTQMTTASDGMTLRQLQEIGAEVGISADAIELAARTVHEPAPATQRKFMGMPIAAAHTAQLERGLTDSEWERLVVDLRDTFGARGTVSGQGSLRQWTNGNLQVLLEPTASGQRLRMRTSKTDARAVMTMGLGMMSAAAAMSIAAIATGAFADKGMLMAMGVLGITGVAALGTTALRLPNWARTRQQQFEAIAARVALTTRSLPPGSEK